MARSSPQKFLHLAWKEHFRDFMQRWNDCKSETTDNFSMLSLWIHGCSGPSWLDHQLGKIHDDENCNYKILSPVDFVALLRFCAKKKDLHRGIHLHNDVLELGLSEQCSDALITMYAKCGELAKAAELLNRHNSTDVFSWTDLIAGYAQSGQGHVALGLFERMQREGLSPDAITFACILKACGSLKAIGNGARIHEEIARLGLLRSNIVVGNALVDMYAKCGALMTAQGVLEELPMRDVVTWSTLITGYAQGGRGKEALYCFQQMQHEGLSPDAVTYACVLKACGSIGANDIGEQIHTEIARQGLLRKDILLGNALVNMYAKCGMLLKAKELLKQLPARSIVSWSAVIDGYAQHGQGAQAIDCYRQMRHEGLLPNAVTYVSVLKACGSIGALKIGKEIHDEIDVQGLLGNDTVLGTALVDMYAKCGAIEKAQQLLEDLPAQSVESWNAVLAVHIQKGEAEQALNCFEGMQGKGLQPTSVSYLCIIRALGCMGAADKGEQIHIEIARQGLVPKDVLLGNVLVDMYAKCGALRRAQQVLEELPDRDVVSWNSLIAGYAQQGHGEQALECFRRMHCEGKHPDEVTFLSILKACGIIGAADEGESVHNEICRLGLLENNNFLATALVDMYARCGAFTLAEQVFEELPLQTTASWTALIAGYVEQGQAEQALTRFEQMKGKGLSPDGITFLCILKACGSIGAAEKGEQIHMEIAQGGLLVKEIMLGNALVDMYAKCGAFARAQQAFQELPVRNTVSWSALIAGYAYHSRGEQAWKCFEQMQHEGLRPDGVTFLCVLKACTNLGASERGEQLYNEIARQGLVGEDTVFGNALVDMYAKCGDFAKAQRVLEKLPSQNFVSWNALITGYAHHGLGEQALQCIEQMQRRGVSPDAVTLLCILKACGSIGRVDDAHMHFSSMDRKYGIKPNLKHYTCIVDVLGRSGQLDKAIEVIQKMDDSYHCVALWCAILGACEKWGDVNAGKWAFKQAIRADKKDPAAYMLMANIYAAAGMQEHSKSIEALRLENMAWRNLTHSWWTDTTGYLRLFLVKNIEIAHWNDVCEQVEDRFPVFFEQRDTENIRIPQNLFLPAR